MYTLPKALFSETFERQIVKQRFLQVLLTFQYTSCDIFNFSAILKVYILQTGLYFVETGYNFWFIDDINFKLPPVINININ